jgi:cGMP-dependent protein kinase
MPTSAELIAMKQQQTAPVATAPPAEPTAAAAAAAAKPRRRRGSDFMPEGGGKMPTSAELMAQKQQGQVPQDAMANAAPTMKMKGSKPSRGSQMMPDTQGQMQNLSVQCAVPNGQPSANEYGYGEGSPAPGGSGRGARRRGSVVRTLMEDKNVDGDERVSNDFNASVKMEDVDVGQVLPQRRSSQDVDEASGPKRAMLKQEHSGSERSDDFAYSGSKRAPFKKKDIGRKAIRDMTSDVEYVHKVIPKTEDAKGLIYGAIKPNLLFRACSSEELVDLVDAFEPQYVPKGSVVIREGDEGDHFYVMERGGIDVYERDVYKSSLYSGVAFGEIALLYSCPRTASVIAKYDCKLWVINRRAFRGITAQHKKRRLELKLEFLKKVKIHDKVLGEILQPSEIHSMALATKIQKFRKGSKIIRQGEKGDAFYMIETGNVDIYIAEKGDKPLHTLTSGTFFGEKALLSSDVRTATCVAASDVKCMLLMRADFVLMLGDLRDLLDRTYEDREKQEEREAMMQKELSYPQTTRFDKNDFDIRRTLGVGAFGFVKLVQWKHGPPGSENTFYALKCVSKEKIIKHKQQEKIKSEENIMKSMVHPFIARCFSVMEDELGKYFLMEALCGGELCELLYHETQFSEKWSMFYSASVLTAFGHMHQHKIAYRDLKPENLVLNNAGYVKIVDFGLAKKINRGQTFTFCGTPDYLAPEVILNEVYDWAVDYWGLGVLIYEMTAGVAPFYAETPMETYEMVISGRVQIPSHFSLQLGDLITKLLHTSQSKRLGRTVGGATSVMCHSWYSRFDWVRLLVSMHFSNTIDSNLFLLLYF